MNKILGNVGIKKIFTIAAVLFSLAGSNVFASDNVLQAIQVNGVNDSYNVILKSDDVAEIQKTVQAPNKMILTLKGIRASKTINTIYNNTSTVDSVVVEPTGDDSIKISLQGQNISNAKVNFDSLKTPLGVLGNSNSQNKAGGEIVLSDPVNSYRPVYNNDNEENTSFDLSTASGSFVKGFKQVLKDQRTSWALTLGLFLLLLLSGMKLIKGNDNEIKVGLTQSLKEREIELYRNRVSADLSAGQEIPATHQGIQGVSSSANYGLRAYQQTNRSPYVSSEIQRPRPAVQNPVNQQIANNLRMQSASPSASFGQSSNQMTAQKTVQKTTSAVTKPKSTNIDSMKFLESMTKIYEKNGRADLAQGLKTNMKKAKMNLT